ncbi:hypothetical protein D3C85_1048690 [compost metagenome]
MPRQNGPTARGVKPHVVIQPESKVADRLDAQACRHQFDGQRDAIDLPDDCGEQPAVGILERAGTHGLRTLDQQFYRRRRHGFGQIGTLRPGQRERRQPFDVFSLDANRLPAGCENAQAGQGAEQFGDKKRQRVEHVLAVVDQQEHVAVLQALQDGPRRVGGVRRCAERAGHRAHQMGLRDQR